MVKNVPAVVVEIVYDRFGQTPPRVFTVITVTKGWKCDVKSGTVADPWR